MKMNSMKSIKIEKVTLNIGAGKDQAKLEKGFTLLGAITNGTPIKTVTNKRIQEWGLRPGLPIGCKITLRKQKALQLLPRLLEAVENKLKYDPKIGILGLEVCVTLERPGFRIKKRKIMSRRIPSRHRISKQEAIDFMSGNFKTLVEAE